MTRVYADGVFDLFHYGHAKLLEQAKKCYPGAFLVVGVCQDKDVHLYKGPTVMTHAERCEAIRHCKWVDEVVEDAPWIITEDFMHKHNIDIVAHDGELYPTSDVEDAYSIPKKLGKFFATQRTEGISTTDLIDRILANNAMYTKRNMDRSSGLG
jgi:choline-phosphate cytidylyltransferase